MSGSTTTTNPVGKPKRKIAATSLGKRLIDAVKEARDELATGTIQVTRAPVLDLGACCGASFKAARLEEGLTLSELAERSGIRIETISRLENGHVKNPSVITLDRLAAAMGRSLAISLGSSPKKRSARR